jgi:UrcA family protein
MHKIIVPALAAVTLAVLPTTVSAETTSVVVPIADLDLTTEAGKATLHSRIEAAKARICGSVEVRQVRDGADRQRCLEETDASVRIELARLTAKSTTLAVAR